MADSSKGSSSKLPLLLVALYFGCRQASRYLLNQHVNACSASQPLLTTRRQAFSPEELRALQAGVQELLPDVKTQPLGKGFKNTRGLVLKFSADGAHRLSDEDDGAYAFLVPFFESVRDPEANAFVLNVLIIPPSENVADPAVSVHLDDTVSVDSARLYNAYSVTVLYLHTPADMEGGTLSLWESSLGTAAAAEEHLPEPNAVVRPQENTLVVFRGDAFHSVSSWRSTRPWVSKDARGDPSGSGAQEYRISLVLEAYRLSSHVYPHATKFEVNNHQSAHQNKTNFRPLLVMFKETSGMAFAILMVVGVVFTAIDVMKGMAKRRASTWNTSGTVASAAAKDSGSMKKSKSKTKIK